MTDDQVLEISAIAPVRQKARIVTEADPDGTLYELTSPEEMLARQLREVGQWALEALALWERDSLTKAQERLLEMRLRQVVKALIPRAPTKTINAIPAMTKRMLAMGFLVRCGEIGGEALTPQALGLFISGSSAPDSSGSTEEILGRG